MMEVFYYEGEFEAIVPYQIARRGNCIDLGEILDIEKRRGDELRRIRQLIVERNFNELEQYYNIKTGSFNLLLIQKI